MFARLRYFVPFIHDSVPKSTTFIYKVVPLYDDDRFKILFRVSRRTFQIILNLIRNDPVFERNKRGRPQHPVDLQLMVVLYRLGCYGEASSIAKTAFLFGLGDGGTVQNITKRVFSVILKLTKRFIFWPNDDERKALVCETFNELPHCIGYVDGTELRLAEKPCEDPDSYLSRKQQYAIKAQIICDHKKRVRNLVVGYPGAVHDARIFKNCAIGSHPERYFDSRQYLLGDSAYKLSKTVITPFRINAKGLGSTPAGRKFNRCLGRYRVRVENTIGSVKERFNSLKEIKTPIIDDDSIKFICDWVTVCVILYNVIIQTNDVADAIQFDEQPTSMEINDGELEFEAGNHEGEARREALVNLLA